LDREGGVSPGVQEVVTADVPGQACVVVLLGH